MTPQKTTGRTALLLGALAAGPKTSRELSIACGGTSQSASAMLRWFKDTGWAEALDETRAVGARGPRGVVWRLTYLGRVRLRRDARPEIGRSA